MKKQGAWIINVYRNGITIHPNFKTHTDSEWKVPSWAELRASQLDEPGLSFKDANCPFFLCILARLKDIKNRTQKNYKYKYKRTH